MFSSAAPTCEAIAECVHDEQFAFYIREDARNKHGVGAQKRLRRFVAKSELTLEDRCKAVQKVKSNSTCRRCGMVGH